MKTLSLWAKHNIRSARLLIILLEVCLFLLAVRLGLLLLHSGVQLPGFAVAIPLFLFCLSILMYYFEKVRKLLFGKRYLHQRVCFFLMGISMFLLTVFFISSEKFLTWNTYSSLSGRESALLIKPAVFPANPLSEAGAKKLDHLLRKMQKHRSLAPLYVALIITGTVLISIVLATLSCSLACNGNGALAALVGVLGIGGIVFLCVWLCRKLLKDQPPPADPIQQRLEQQKRNKEKRLERRNLKHEDDINGTRTQAANAYSEAAAGI